jgi:hypothetical protein
MIAFPETDSKEKLPASKEDPWSPVLATFWTRVARRFDDPCLRPVVNEVSSLLLECVLDERRRRNSC